MNDSTGQQIVISGVGGQGVLFVTRLMAEAAIRKGLRVVTSETHGMAQRGGTVMSHLKVGDFSSPLIRPARADGIVILKAENIQHHGVYLKPDGWAVVNNPMGNACELTRCTADADRIALEIGNPKAVNMIMLGFVLSQVPDLYASLEDIEAVLRDRFGRDAALLAASVNALKAGYVAGTEDTKPVTSKLEEVIDEITTR